jgi:hypothetical protein
MNITSSSRAHHFRVESSAAVLFPEGPRGIETAPPAAPARLDIPRVFPGGRGAEEVLGPFE